MATGAGILTRDTGEKWEDRWKLEARGSPRDGKQHGHWVEHNDPCGILYPNSENGPYVDGKQHGHWVERFDNKNDRAGPYIDGLRHGRWGFRDFDGDRYELAFVRGATQ